MRNRAVAVAAAVSIAVAGALIAAACQKRKRSRSPNSLTCHGASCSDAKLGRLVLGLKDPARIRTVFLQGSAVTDSGLKHLLRFNNLRTLALDGSRVGDAGMAALTRLPRLRFLDVEHTQGLLNSLQALVLTSTAVGDAGLAHLRKLSTGLFLLDLRGTRVTKAATVDFVKSGCRVRL